MKKFFNKFLSTGVMATLALTTAMVFTLAGNASAACFTYNGDNQQSQTSNTPVFNNFCNAPFGIGSEADFVRIRQNSNGDVKDNQNNPAYTNSVSNACNNGAKFDVWNYIHNDANQDLNGANGEGSAVAHNVELALNQTNNPLGKTGSTFNFDATISASNAASVYDNATLNCNGKQVKLNLVKNSVNVYSKAYGWQGLSDAAASSKSPIGSPTVGSGNVYGCWDYRVVVVYQVTVEETPPQPTPSSGKCELFSIFASDNRTVTVNNFKTSVSNATFKNVVIDWGDSSDKTTVTEESKVVGQKHQYKEDKSYVITAVASFTDKDGKTITHGGSGTNCVSQVNFKPNQPPTVTPPTPPSTTTPTPTKLVNTGAGSVIGMFAAVTAAGTVAYRKVLGRRLSEV